MLLNIGFKIAESYECDYVIFHDVDMIPLIVDYSYSDIPLHLATDFKPIEGDHERELFEAIQEYTEVEQEYTNSRSKIGRVISHLRENII